MKFLLVSILLVCLNQSYAQSFGKCSEVPIKDFDSSQYLGKWFEIERFEYIFEKNLQCVRAEYGRLNDTAVTVRNTGLNTKTQNVDEVLGYAYVPNTQEPNRLLVVLPVVVANVTIITNTGNYDVLETDYKNYALVYSCRQVIPSILKLEIAWILSRTKTLDQSIVNRLKQVAKSYNLDVSKFEVIDQSCD